MVYLFASISKNLCRIAAAPWSIAIWIGVPLIVGALLGAVMGGSPSENAKLHLLIADQDNSVLSNVLLTALSSDELADLLLIEPVTAEIGAEILDDGDASAMLVVPPGFQDAFLSSEAQALRLVVNPLQSILPEMAEELANVIADFGSYAQVALGPELAAAQLLATEFELGSTNSAEAADAVGSISAGIAIKLVRALPYLAEAPIEIAVVTTEGAREASFSMLFFPGLLMMSVIFAAQGLAEDFWQEREMGTLRRLKSTSASVLEMFTSRMISFAIAFLIVLLPLSFLGFVALDLPWTKLPLALAWLIVAGLMLSSLASFIQVLAPTRKAGSLFSMLVFFPLLLIGGSFFPIESMPDFLAAFGRFTPNGMMLEPLKRYLIGTGSLFDFGPALAAAFLAIFALTAVTAWRLTTTFSNH